MFNGLPDVALPSLWLTKEYASLDAYMGRIRISQATHCNPTSCRKRSAWHLKNIRV
jgi:hypothetical protein